MRFFYAKKEQICKHCGSPIIYGDEAVVIRWKNKNIFIPLVFHVGCYIEWVTDSFNRRWGTWKLGATPRPIRKKRGRKFLYPNRILAKDVNRRKSLINYHLKEGNLDRVRELNIALKEILDGSI